MVYCISAILEFPTQLLDKYISGVQVQKKTETERSKNFWCAFDAIDIKSLELIEQGIAMAIEFQKSLINEASYLMDKRGEIQNAKKFTYTILNNETLEEKKNFF